MKSFRQNPPQNGKANPPGQGKRKQNRSNYRAPAPVTLNPQKPDVQYVKKKQITPFGQVLRTGGRIAGAFLGNQALGQTIGEGISRIFGQGQYTIEQNTLVNQGPPSFASLESGMRIHHREFVQNIQSSVDFNNTTFQISPTNSTLFPWLSTIATNFDQYQFKGLVLYFSTTCGTGFASTNNGMGVVGMTTVYDPSSPPLPNKRNAEDYGGCTAGVPSASILHPVECKPSAAVLDKFYCQINSITNKEDWKFYSQGILNVFTEGMQQAGVAIGELWVTYDIVLYKPRIRPIGTIGAAASKISATTSTMTTAQVFGTADIPESTGNLGCSYVGGNGYIKIPKATPRGYYFCNWMSTTGASTVSYACNALSGNVTLTNYFQNNSASAIQAPNGSAANAWHGASVLLYKSDEEEGQFKFVTNSGSEVGPKQFDITIIKVPNSLAGASALLTSTVQEQDLFAKFLDKLKSMPEYEHLTKEVALPNQSHDVIE